MVLDPAYVKSAICRINELDGLVSGRLSRQVRDLVQGTMTEGREQESRLEARVSSITRAQWRRVARQRLRSMD